MINDASANHSRDSKVFFRVQINLEMPSREFLSKDPVFPLFRRLEAIARMWDAFLLLPGRVAHDSEANRHRGGFFGIFDFQYLWLETIRCRC